MIQWAALSGKIGTIVARDCPYHTFGSGNCGPPPASLSSCVVVGPPGTVWRREEKVLC